MEVFHLGIFKEYSTLLSIRPTTLALITHVQAQIKFQVHQPVIISTLDFTAQAHRE
jgi:hypothetical protein